MANITELLKLYKNVENVDPEKLLQSLFDDELRTMVLVIAEAFRNLKKEAIRRGTWDDIKHQKVGK